MIQQFHQSIMKSRLKYMEDDLKLTKDFLNENDMLIQMKKEQRTKASLDKQKDRLNFFPFTNGDAVEEQRSTIQEERKKELKELHK